MKSCNQCGKCCIKYGNGALVATQQEIDSWELFSPDIFSYVNNNEIWVDPHTKMKLSSCPFLVLEDKISVTAANKYICSIYEDRPDDCRQYPSLISEMVRDECEMIEAIDLLNTKRAQEMLNTNMRASGADNN